MDNQEARKIFNKKWIELQESKLNSLKHTVDKEEFDCPICTDGHQYFGAGGAGGGGSVSGYSSQRVLYATSGTSNNPLIATKCGLCKGKKKILVLRNEEE